MSVSFLTLIEDGRSIEIGTRIQQAAEAGRDSASVRLEPEATLDALGWKQKPEGLCRGDVCIPISRAKDLITEQGIDLEGLARLLGRPVAIDREQGVASLGAAAESHGAQLAGGDAPDFTLPDLSGAEYTLSSFRGKKVLLIAYASW